MKKRVLIAALIAISAIYGLKADAQVRFNVNVNIGSQPAWGPTGYDYAEYYYMPDIDCYYYVPERRFIYMDAGRWCSAPALPPRYHYDLYRGYKVVINEPRPYLRGNVYRNRYAGYRGAWGRQPIIRDTHNPRYFADQPHRGNDRGHWERHEGGRGGGPGWGRGGDHGDHGGPGRGHGGDHGNHGRHGH